jgi:hypothetical protein
MKLATVVSWPAEVEWLTAVAWPTAVASPAMVEQSSKNLRVEGSNPTTARAR